MFPVRSLTVSLLVVCAAASASFLAPGTLVATGGEQAASPPTIFIDASVTDENGRAVTTLRPEDLRVTMNGEPRKVVSLRYVHRGPGADAAAALADRSRDAPAAAERIRSLLLIADENGILQGQQKPVAAVVARMVDELGAADQAAVATLPRPPAELVLSNIPTGRQTAVALIRGRAVSSAQPAAQALPKPNPDTNDQSVAAGGGEPDAQARFELDRQAARDRQGIQEDFATEGANSVTAGASLAGPARNRRRPGRTAGPQVDRGLPAGRVGEYLRRRRTSPGSWCPPFWHRPRGRAWSSTW